MKNLGKQILELVGGEGNIKSITHCATRLRFQFFDKSKVDIERLKENKTIVGVVNAEQFQIIIGIHVRDVYLELTKQTGLGVKQIKQENGTKKKIGAIFLDAIVSIFSPLLPVLAGSGILRGLVILASQIGILSEQSGTYIILTAASTAVFTFLPILLAVTTSRKFKASMYISILIMGALLMPNFQALMTDGVGTIVHFMGIPVLMVQYTGSVIPAICAIFVQSKIEKRLKIIIPQSLHLILIPAISLFLMVPLTAIVFGPVGVGLGVGIAKVVKLILNLNGWISGAFISGIWNILIMFGIHWAVNTTIVIPNIALTGHSRIIALAAGANFGMAGACLGVWIKTKDKELKGYTISAIMSIFLSGIVEPALYGVGLKYKRPLITGIIASALGGAVMGGMGVVGYAFVFGGITTIPAFMGPKILWYVVGLLTSFVMGTVLTVLFGFEKKKEGTQEEKITKGVDVYSPLKGKVCALSNVKDEIFSKKILGEGIAVIPTEGIIKAPFDGRVVFVADTYHALALKNSDGMEVLIHIGLDTVELNGKYMKPFIKNGDEIKKGQILMEVDLEAIQKFGYDIITPVVIANVTENKKIQLCDDKDVVEYGDILISVE
ncbi:MAG: beta-glucoside-specific PTS transporter subunit IIABC [Anaerostipes sp.]|nr:beta-glucoside-specific PTS transporter subunit IIABC [Anaerostipes sp.]